MRILGITALSVLLAACADDKKDETPPITNQPTTQVDYSKLENTPQTEAPLALASQNELSHHIKNGLRLQLKNGPTHLLKSNAGAIAEPSAAPAPAPAAPGAPVAESASDNNGSSGYSETNVHVAGVDEADYAKYDGSHWFVATVPHNYNFLIDDSKAGFNIVATDPEKPNAEVIASVQLDEDNNRWGNISEMYLVQDPTTKATTHVATIRNRWGSVRPFLPGNRFIALPQISLPVSPGIAPPPTIPPTPLPVPELEPAPAVADISVSKIAVPAGDDSAAISTTRIAPPLIDILYPAPTNSSIRIQLTDVQTPSDPQKDWELTIDGSLINSRKVGNMLYLVTRYDSWVNGLHYDANTKGSREKNENELAAVDTEKLLPNYQIGDKKQPLSNDCYLQQGIKENYGFSSLVNITAIDLSQQKMVSSQCINGSLESLSMTPTSLYLTGTVQTPDGSSTKTVIHKFNLDENGPSYAATGSVTGGLGWNSDVSFRMHEHDNTFRIVTTNWHRGGAAELQGPSHTLTILEENNQSLETLSTLPNGNHPEPIGKPGEDIYSVRFEKDRAYIVTFRRTDPLYAIDLSDPSNPMIAGELEIPGFATYMHPVGGDYLFTLGRDADENGRTKGMKAELIDVRADAPTVVNSLYFKGRATNSVALNDLKALSFKRDDTRLRITMPINVYTDNNGWEHSGLQLMEIVGLPALSAEMSSDVPSASNIVAERKVAPGAQLVDAGTIITESRKDRNYAYSFGANRSIIHDDAVFYAYNNGIWAAEWSAPEEAIGPIQAAPMECTEEASPPAMNVLVQVPKGSDQDPCEAELVAFNNGSNDLGGVALEAGEKSKDGLSCTFSGGNQAGDFTIITELDGYIATKNHVRVYRNQCRTITSKLTINLKPVENVICTLELRPSLRIYVDIEDNGSASACDVTVNAIHNGKSYQLDGNPESFSSATLDSGGSVTVPTTPIALEEKVTAQLRIADPLPVPEPQPPQTSTRCIFTGPFELAGRMDVELSLDGYTSKAIENIFVEKGVCHVKTYDAKAWLSIAPE